MASKIGDFKILKYRRSLTLAISKFNDHLKRLLSTLIGAAFNGKSMLPIVRTVFSMNNFGQTFHSFHWLLFSRFFLMELKRRP